MADTKLSALALGTLPDFFYGIEGGTPKRYAGFGIFNVKNYGAIGDGSNNDASAIQAAINAAMVAGGTVFFPPGTYLIGSKLVCTALGAGSFGGVRFIGSGSTNVSSRGSTIKSDTVADFMLDTTNGDGGGGNGRVNVINHIEGINFQQGETTAGSCVQVIAIGTTITNCYFSLPGSGTPGYCVKLSNAFTGSQAVTIAGCIFNGGGQKGTAIGGGFNGLSVISCRISGFDVGMELTSGGSSSGSFVSGGSIESCNTAVVAGNGAFVSGLQTEDCGTGVQMLGSGIVVTGCWISGPGVPPNLTTNYGILASAVTGGAIVGNAVSIGNGVGIDVSAVTGQTLLVQGNTSNAPTKWAVPADYTGSNADVDFSGNNTPYLGVVFANLPVAGGPSGASQALQIGGEYEISNSNTVTFGATIAGGGTNKVRGRWNGSNWTVCGA